jgi:hypothetical protein
MNRIHELRSEYHRQLCSSVLGRRDGIPNNADRSSKVSRKIAERLIQFLPYQLCTPPPDQTVGTRFEKATASFLQKSFSLLKHIRPGRWGFFVAETARSIEQFEQYEHLKFLSQAIVEHPDLAAILGSDYIIKPDIVIGRYPLDDQEINAEQHLLEGEEFARYTPLRKRNRPAETLIFHASISCKWTLRSDRAQNTRTEALNLIRNRKGHTPHIVVVTAEPLPTRIASLALGTGDIDCVYHFALPELIRAVEESNSESQKEMLDMLIEGRRLRDIADLPFDLAI